MNLVTLRRMATRNKIGQRIRLARKQHNMSQAELARALGVTEASVSNWERLANDPSTHNMVELARILEVPHRWLAEGLGAAPAGDTENTVDIRGYVGAGAEYFPFDDQASGAGIDSVHLPGQTLAPDAVALEVRGDSMYPAMRDGDILVYDRRYSGTDIRHLVGMECVCETLDGRIFIKEIRAGSTAGTWTLMSLNAPPRENMRLRWAAPVRLVIKRYSARRTTAA